MSISTHEQNELLQKRANVFEQAKELLKRAETENRDLNAEEKEQYTRMTTDMKELRDRADRETELARIETDLNTIVRNAKRPEIAQVASSAGLYTATPEYRALFDRAIRGDVGALVELRGGDLYVGTVGSTSAGGVTVPTILATTVKEILLGDNALRPLAEVMNAPQPFKLIKEKPRGVSFPANITASGISEKAQYTEDANDDYFELVSFSPTKLGRTVKTDEELLNMANFDIAAYVVRKGAQAVANEEERLDVTEVTTNATEISAGAAPTYDTIIDLLYGVVAGYRRNGTFVAHDTTIAAIMKLKDTQNLPIWQPSVQAGQPDTLRGRPIVSSAYMPQNASGNKILVFGDFKQCFTINDFITPTVQRLNELYAENGQVGFRFTHLRDSHVTDSRGLGWYRRSS